MRTSWLTRAGLPVVVAIAAGCASNSYVYMPADRVATRIEGVPTAVYPVPAEAPQGEVYVTTLGIQPLRAPNGGWENLLRVRLSVANRGASPWSAPVGAQQLALPNGTTISPVHVDSDAPGGPVLTIAPNSQRVVDLYFRLPSEMAAPDRLASFQLQWSIDIGGRAIGDRTAFNRVPADPTYAYHAPMVGSPRLAVGLGLWAPWWYPSPWYWPGPYVGGRVGYYGTVSPRWTPRPPMGPGPVMQGRPVR